MLSMLRNAARTAMTGKDNKSVDLGRVLWAAAVAALIGMEAWSMHRGQTFDPIQFATAAGALLAGGAGSLALKSKTEPDPGAQS